MKLGNMTFIADAIDNIQLYIQYILKVRVTHLLHKLTIYSHPYEI